MKKIFLMILIAMAVFAVPVQATEVEEYPYLANPGYLPPTYPNNPNTLIGSIERMSFGEEYFNNLDEHFPTWTGKLIFALAVGLIGTMALFCNRTVGKLGGMAGNWVHELPKKIITNIRNRKNQEKEGEYDESNTATEEEAE